MAAARSSDPSTAVALGEDQLGASVEHPAGVRQGWGPDLALEQDHSQLGFELLDLGRDGRLSHVQPAGGPGEAALADDSVEVHQLPQFHTISLDDHIDHARVFDL
jgi:hypothetical protein